VRKESRKWYKSFIRTPFRRGLMMNAIDQKRALEQLTLFDRRPIRMRWDEVPFDSRQEVVRILATMLVEHRTRERLESKVGGKEQ
jgi:hypothetical protein